MPQVVRNGALVGDIQGFAVRKVSLPVVQLPEAVGPWLADHGLYSKGNDFTSDMARTPGHVGTSSFLALWEGRDTSCAKGMNQADLYVVLSKGRPVGVVAWVYTNQIEPIWFEKRPGHPNHHAKWRVPVARLGNLMAYMEPRLRGLGVCRTIVRDLILPSMRQQARIQHAQGRLPLVGAADAMNHVFTTTCDLPATSGLDLCRAMVDEVWRTLERARMWPERPGREAAWLVERQACPTKRPRQQARA